MSASECRNYHRPTSLREALALMTGAEVPLWPVAGGTDLLVKDHRRQMPPGPWEMMSLTVEVEAKAKELAVRKLKAALKRRAKRNAAVR